MHVLVVKREHIYFEEITAGYNDFQELKRLYQDVSKFSIKGYTSEIVGFTEKALKLNIPQHVKEAIEAL
jgi:hypothetical protein